MSARPLPRAFGRLLIPNKSLLAQIAWFNRLRFGAVVGMLVMSWYATAFEVVDSVWPILAVAGVTLGVNLGYIAFYERIRDYEQVSLRRHVDLQIAIDLALLTLLLHFNGGVTNPLVLFYLFHTFIAAVLLSVRAAVLVASVALGLAILLGVAEYRGWVQHHPVGIGLMELDRVSPGVLVAWLASLGAVMVFSVYFITSVVRQLSAQEADLAGLGQQLAQSEKLASVGTLAAGVSHEINNPIGVIRSKSKILRYRIDDGDAPDALLSEIDVIEKHARRISDITQGLLTFSREEAFELQPLRINQVVAEGCDLVRVPFKDAQVELESELAAGDPVIAGSPNHLLQILVNVLLNARDASAEGGRVLVRVDTLDDEVQVRIRDYGSGIAAADLAKIFDPFFTTKDVGVGTGLGLAISHGLVERHGGRILVDSEVGVGTEFLIELPRS